MAGGRRPGLLGTYPMDVDDGTFAKTESPRPGLLGTADPEGGRYMRAAVALVTPPVYDEDVHVSLTYALAFAAGFEDADAIVVAAANQAVDDNPVTSPMPGWRRSRYGVPYYDLGIERRRLWHFTTIERQAEVKGQYKRTGSLRDLGRWMHVLQDTFSHAKLGPGIGQVGTSVDPRTGDAVHNSPNPFDAGVWHETDDPSKNPEKAENMARRTYAELVEAKERLLGNKKILKASDAVGYEKIASLVREFCHETSKEKRTNKAIQIVEAVNRERESMREKLRRQEAEEESGLGEGFRETERRRTRDVRPQSRGKAGKRN